MAARKNPSKGVKPDKLIRDAILVELMAAVGKGKGKHLRRVARALVEKAGDGDVAAIKEVADRIDGRVPQAVMGKIDNTIIVEVVKFGD